MESPTLEIEQGHWDRGLRLVAGVDEAGRGCLAGPVVAAAVILPQDFDVEGVRDSKLIPAGKREFLAGQIMESAIAVGVGVCTPEEIDRLNVLWASMEAMRRALQSLRHSPEHVLIDGNRCFPEPEWPVELLVGGDRTSLSVAAASIIAKTTRDRMMREYHEHYPAYGWEQNVGYPTREHYEALAVHGPCPLHRKSFRLEA